MDTKDCNLPIFYICPICGNIIEMVHSSGIIPMCCNQEMEVLKCNTVEGAGEKHLPVYEFKDEILIVKVGEMPHPMDPDHHIEWIELVTDQGIQRKKIYPKPEASACFCLHEKEKILAIYEYCNLHGLWASLHPDCSK